MVPRAVACWFLLMILAFVNGAARELFLVPRLGPAGAHVASTILLCGLIMGAAWVVVPWIAPATGRAALTVGALWLLMTLGFEFLAGHYLFRKPWPVLLADYNLLRGRIWILVPLVTLLTPLWAWRLRIR